MDKKYLYGIVSSIIIIPALVFGWHNIQSIWAAPDKIVSVEKKVEKQETIQEQLSRLVVEQQVRLEKAEIVNTMQVAALKDANQSTKEQLQLIAELKKKR